MLGVEKTLINFSIVLGYIHLHSTSSFLGSRPGRQYPSFLEDVENVPVCLSMTTSPPGNWNHGCSLQILHFFVPQSPPPQKKKNTPCFWEKRIARKQRVDFLSTIFWGWFDSTKQKRQNHIFQHETKCGINLKTPGPNHPTMSLTPYMSLLICLVWPSSGGQMRPGCYSCKFPPMHHLLPRSTLILPPGFLARTYLIYPQFGCIFQDMFCDVIRHVSTKNMGRTNW